MSDNLKAKCGKCGTPSDTQSDDPECARCGESVLADERCTCHKEPTWSQAQDGQRSDKPEPADNCPIHK